METTQQTIQIFQIIISAITIAGAILGAYFGVKLAITELKGEIKVLNSRLDGVEARLDRVEDKL